MSFANCGVNWCFARRHKVARPNCAFVFRAGFFKNALSWLEKLANEWVVQARLPFLNKGEFKASVVSSLRIDGNGSPDV